MKPTSLILLGLLFLIPDTSFAKHPDELTHPKFEVSQKQLLCNYFLGNRLRELKKGLEIVGNLFSGKKSLEQLARQAAREDAHFWDILKEMQGSRFASEGNQLPIFNTHESMDPIIIKDLGTCWGHASLKMKLTNLSVFDPTGKFSALPTGQAAIKGTLERKRFYLDILKDMIDNKAVRFVPGFATLNDFSKDEDLIDYFKHEAVLEWVRHAASWQSLEYLSQKDYTPARMEKFLSEVQYYLDRGINPKIIFDENSNKMVDDYQGSIHVVLAVAIHELEPTKNGARKTAIVVWDDKKPYPYNYETLVMNHESGAGFFWPWKWEPRTQFDAQGQPIKDKDGNVVKKIAGIDFGGGRVNQYRMDPQGISEMREIVYQLNEFRAKNPEAWDELKKSVAMPEPWPVLKDPGKPMNPLVYKGQGTIADAIKKRNGKNRYTEGEDE